MLGASASILSPTVSKVKASKVTAMKNLIVTRSSSVQAAKSPNVHNSLSQVAAQSALESSKRSQPATNLKTEVLPVRKFRHSSKSRFQTAAKQPCLISFRVGSFIVPSRPKVVSWSISKPRYSSPIPSPLRFRRRSFHFSWQSQTLETFHRGTVLETETQ